jgi:hypothetical protein
VFIESSNYAFLTNIKNNVSRIKAEFEAAIAQTINIPKHSVDHYSDYWVKDNGFHPEQIGHDIREGAYSTLAIFKAGFQIKNFDVQSCFPETLRLLRDVHRLQYAAFFVMAPGARLERHKHSRSHLIYHVLLNDLLGAECEVQCGSEIKHLRYSGDDVLFNYSLPHETFNHASNTRVNLVVDFIP